MSVVHGVSARRRILAGLVIVLAFGAGVASAIGLTATPDPRAVQTVRGTTAVLFGGGVYAYDTLFTGAANRATDAVTLLLGIPLLLLAWWRARAGSLRWRLILPGAVVWFLYVYASLALAVSFNELFVVYTILFSASLYAFILALDDASRLPVHPAPGRRLPRRSTAAFLWVTGAITALVWIGPVLAAQLAGSLPARLDSYTTAVTIALDSAVIVPAAVIAGVLIWRGSPLGYVLAVPLLVLEAALAPMMTAQTISQVSAGVQFAAGELIGILGGFAVLAVAAGVVLTRVLLNVEDDPDIVRASSTRTC